MRTLLLKVGLVLVLAQGAVFAQQNVVNNGSFETGSAGQNSFPDWDWIGPADNNSDYGVARSSASPNVAEQGTNYAFFHGHPTDGSQDCLGESVYMRVGAQYTISYWLGTDGTTLGSGASMWVVIGSSFGIDLSQDIALPSFFPNSSSALPYQFFTTNITATAASAILSFHGIDATSSILLDNVSMVTAPQINLSAPSSNKLVFAWPSAASAYRLQEAASLSATNWTTVTNEPATNGSSSQIILTPPNGNTFYRLALQ